jgi:DMSO/TMAO reductase YedYZ molybdopterin-dependent catalytic subunit
VKKKILQASLLLTILGLAFASASAVSLGAQGDLQVEGEVNHPLTLTINEIEAMPQTTVNAALYCYGILVTSGDWTGLQLGLLLETVGYDTNAGSVAFYATDGYTVSITMETALREDVIIAYEQNGQPLSEGLRLVIPDANGNLWISMIDRLQVNMEHYETSQSQAESPKITSPTSPAPQPSATAQPTPSPSPTPEATPAPAASPSSSPTATPINAETAPANWITAAVAGVLLAVASASLIIYSKRRRR